MMRVLMLVVIAIGLLLESSRVHAQPAWPPDTTSRASNHLALVGSNSWFTGNQEVRVTRDGGGGNISFAEFLSEAGTLSNRTYVVEASAQPYVTGCLGSGYVRIGPYSAGGGVTNVLIRGETGDRTDVVIAGADPSVDPDFWKTSQYGGPSSCGDYQFINFYNAQRVVIADITFRNFPGHILKLDGQDTWRPDDIVFSNLELLDCGDQIIKGHTCRDGILQGCYIHYTDGLNEESSYETQGIDLHNSVNWIMRDNVFEKCRIPSGMAHASNGSGILCWNGCDSILAERNLFIDCDAAVKLGQSGSEGSGDYFTVRNNVVVNTDTDSRYDLGAPNIFDVGPGATHGGIYHNTVWNPANGTNVTLIRTENAAFPFANNLYYRGTTHRAASAENNAQVADESWFEDVAAYDFRLTSNHTVPYLSDVTVDVVGGPRADPASAGAFEYGSASTMTCRPTGMTAEDLRARIRLIGYSTVNTRHAFARYRASIDLLGRTLAFPVVDGKESPGYSAPAVVVSRQAD